MITNILLTGKPGIGKTTLILKVIDNLDAGGFYTKEIRESGNRVGFELITLSGQRKVFAHRDFQTKYRVGKYSIDVSVLDDLGVESIRKAISDKKVIVIDEIGKMELFSEKFRKIVISALDSHCSVLATITKASHPFVERVKSRNDVEIIEVTERNGNLLVDAVREKINQIESSAEVAYAPELQRRSACPRQRFNS